MWRLRAREIRHRLLLGRVQRENDLIKPVRTGEQAALGRFNRHVVGGDCHLGGWNDESCHSSGEKRYPGHELPYNDANANHS